MYHYIFPSINRSMKDEIVKSLVSGTIKGLIVTLFLMWGVRSVYFEVQTEKAYLNQQQLKMSEEKEALEIKYNILYEQHRELLKNYKLLQFDLKTNK